MKTIGLIGGMSWESTAVYYRLLNEMARDRLGGLHSAKILLWSFDFAEIESLQASGDWNRGKEEMIQAALKLERGGAECLLICANTMHMMADEVEGAISIPLIHIADAAAKAALRCGVKRPLLLGTRITMERDFFRERLKRHGIEAIVPEEGDRGIVHSVIYDELCRGVIRRESKTKYLEIVNNMRKEGMDGVILGCTEIGLLMGPDDVDIPVLDTTPIHAEAAMDFALS